MPRLCLNLLNSLPFPSEERPEAFQQPHSLSPSRGAPCVHSTRDALCPCSPPSSQDISTSQRGHTLSPLECSPSDASAIARPFTLSLALRAIQWEVASHGSLPPLLSQGFIGCHCHAHTNYYNHYLFLLCTPKHCSATTRTLLLLISWSQITMALK